MHNIHVSIEVIDINEKQQVSSWGRVVKDNEIVER
jgi:hypothetical protein